MNVAIIPARGGSRRIPRKNIRPFHGKPIIAYSIEAARESGLFDRVVVSTEDDAIAVVALRYGAEVLTRSKHLCQDEVGTLEVTREAAYRLGLWTAEEEVQLEDGRQGIPERFFGFGEEDLVCCIYATAPLLHVDFLKSGYQAVDPGENSNHAFAVGVEPLRDAGQFYWSTVSALACGVPYEDRYSRIIPLPECRVCDINTEDDWRRAEEMYAALTVAA